MFTTSEEKLLKKFVGETELYTQMYIKHPGVFRTYLPDHQIEGFGSYTFKVLAYFSNGNLSKLIPELQKADDKMREKALPKLQDCLAVKDFYPPMLDNLISKAKNAGKQVEETKKGKSFMICKPKAQVEQKEPESDIELHRHYQANKFTDNPPTYHGDYQLESITCEWPDEGAGDKVLKLVVNYYSTMKFFPIGKGHERWMLAFSDSSHALQYYDTTKVKALTGKMTITIRNGAHEPSLFIEGVDVETTDEKSFTSTVTQSDISSQTSIKEKFA